MDIPQINLDDLYEKKKQDDLNTVASYNKILTKIHHQIKIASRQKINNQCCWYVVPEFVFGIPCYDIKACIIYIVKTLEDNGFKIKYTHPNLLFISWNHWIPDYVRIEYKKRTGIAIDGFGNEIGKKEDKEKDKNGKEIKLDKKSLFKSIQTYKPSGIIYNEDLLKSI
jgi:hypothetical protein